MNKLDIEITAGNVITRLKLVGISAQAKVREWPQCLGIKFRDFQQPFPDLLQQCFTTLESDYGGLPHQTVENK